MDSILNNRTKLLEVTSNIADILKMHHKIYDLPVKAELWENVLSNALAKSSIPNDWKPDFNHVQGVDMCLDDSGERISCKSGAIVDTDLEFSGSRMTKYPTLESKLDFLSKKLDDAYMLLSRDKKEWESGLKKYYFIAFSSDMLDYSSLQWQNNFYKRGAKRGQINGHSGLSEAIEANIHHSMSHQIWTKILNFKNNKEIFVKEIYL